MYKERSGYGFPAKICFDSTDWRMSKRYRNLENYDFVMVSEEQITGFLVFDDDTVKNIELNNEFCYQHEGYRRLCSAYKAWLDICRDKDCYRVVAIVRPSCIY